MIKIELEKQFSSSKAYFYITIDKNVIAATSFKISKHFGLDIDIYNDILAKKVIQHGDFLISPGNGSVFSKDIAFALHNISAETYVERFKEVFCKELTMLALSCISESEGYFWR